MQISAERKVRRIKAIQYEDTRPSTLRRLVDFVGEPRCFIWRPSTFEDRTPRVIFQTTTLPKTARLGDWLIKNKHGEIMVVSPQQFNERYKVIKEKV